jgi:hypothetical protein
MIEHGVLDSGKLWAPHGIRSLAADDPPTTTRMSSALFQLAGPVWPHANWMVMHPFSTTATPKPLWKSPWGVKLCLDDLDRN